MPTQQYLPAFPIDELVEHPDNPRRGDEEAIEASMEAHGFYGAVLVQSSTRRIIAGNHRTRVARRRGDATIPVLMLDVDDDRARRILLVDNRTNDTATYDGVELTRLLAELAAGDDGLAGTGFDVTDLADLLKHWGPAGDPDEIPAAPVTPRTALGDLWVLGRHRLLCGDCTNQADVDRVLNGIKPRLMVTDPPYLVDYDGGNHPASWGNTVKGREKHWDDYIEHDPDGDLYRDFLALAVPHLAADAPSYQWFADRRWAQVKHAWNHSAMLWHQTLIWVKHPPALVRLDFMQATEMCAFGWVQGHRPKIVRRAPINARNYWELSARAGRDLDEHPTAKPVQLYTDPYTWHLRAGEWAYEPFSGSGTAIAAGEVTGRRVAAVELSPRFVDVACARWQQLSGELPILERTGEAHDFGQSMSGQTTAASVRPMITDTPVEPEPVDPDEPDAPVDD